MIDKFRESFKEEASELLAELETALLDLEASPEDTELIGRVFRAMHTLKGSGAMFGFDDIATFTHEVETVFDLVRNGVIPVSRELINLTLAARDQVKGMLQADEGTGTWDSAVTTEITVSLKKLAAGSIQADVNCQTGTEVTNSQVSSSESTLSGDELTTAKQFDPSSEGVTYRIRFAPVENIFMNGTNPVSLLNELRGLGHCCVVAQTRNIPSLTKINPESCYLFWDVVLTTTCGINAIQDVFIFVEDDCELKIEQMQVGTGDISGDYRKLGEILVERGDLSTEDLGKTLSGMKRIGEVLVESGLVTPDRINSALTEQNHAKLLIKERQSQEVAASIRVPAEKLDILVNLVGELVTVQARLSQTAALKNESILTSIAEEVERLTGELRDNALNIRMLPIGSTFSKFQRLVRDLSNELGKEVEMTTEGAETELDKTVIERLSDPLVHLIRNSIDHGVELPEIRTAAGKDRKGTVHLTAVHSGDSVLITIKDDGAGLDKDAIRRKAVEKGLIQENAEMSEKEIYSLIFAPGFSTAQKVTSVSGRGVGMDVVKRAIDALRGTIELSSKRGNGTTITVRIPLTLAIIESLLVKIGDDRFVLPLSIVDECVELSRTDIANAHGRNLASVRGRLIPYIPLRERFRVTGEVPDIQQIVITRIDGIQVGFVVDHVIGEHQTVIKSLGKMYKNIEGISGATILGDGDVALILDIQQLARREELAERLAGGHRELLAA